MCIAVAFISFFVLQIWGIVLFVRLRPYRIDLKQGQHGYEGASRVNAVNFFSRANYSPEGQRLLRWTWAQRVATLATAAIGVLLC